LNLLVMLVAVTVGAVLQAALPTLSVLGNAPAPVLTGVVLYYALLRERGVLLVAAVVGGLVQDALGLVPLGYSSFGYCLIGLAARGLRDAVLVRQWTTHVLFGAAGNVALQFFLAFVLLANGTVQPAWLWLLAKLIGALLGGAIVVPFVFRGIAALDRLVGNVEAEEA
jgi:rod shape-determining protein MreD